MVDAPKLELIETGSKQLREAKEPPKFIEQSGVQRLVRTHEYYGVLRKAWQNEGLTWEEIKAFLSQSESQLGVLDNIPDRFSFSMKERVEGKRERKKALDEVLTTLGVSAVNLGDEEFTPSEIWDAVYYQAAEKKEKYPYLKNDRGEKIIEASEKICKKLDKQQQRTIISFEDGLLSEDIDPRSLTAEKLLARDGVNSVRLNQKQKASETGKVQIKDTLTLRAKLDRYDVITAFLNQRAEGRAGEKEAPLLGSPQLPGMISYKEGEKTIKVQGLSDDEVRSLVLILEDVDAFTEKHKSELQGGFQGRKGWIAEATLRRMHEIWKETTDIFQKDTASLLTWTSELGHGSLVSEWLSIPTVAEVLTWPELYQQREPVTDKPIDMKQLPEIEKLLKQKAKDLDIPSSKVDLAIFLSQILQLGYWTGRVGWKTRHPGEKYGFLDIGAGLPMWSWEVFIDKSSNLTPEEAKVFTPEKRKVFDLQLAQLNAYLVGMAMTGYTVEHLGRIPDEASQEDLLYLSEVGEAPIYTIPDDALIKVVADLEEIPVEKMRQLFQTSYLHREQYRWQFVYSYYSGLLESEELGKYAGKIGEEAVEKKYFNPKSDDDRRQLIDYLKKADLPAAATLSEAGLRAEWITDEVIKDLCTDECMLAIKTVREDFYRQFDREITLNDLAKKPISSRLSSEERNHQVATILEFVLRDKRTWGLDMGINNSFFNDPKLPQAIREKGGFSADQVGLMVTSEYERKSHVDTLSTFLEVMAKAHMRNEFYTGKDIVEKLAAKYGDIPRVRANSLVNPWTILETSASLRAAMMLIGYWDAGYAHTGGRMVTDQEALYDQLDIDRIFHERFYPVVGAAQRVQMGREKYIQWQKDICLRQRAKISAALARFYERQFFQQGASIQAIMGYKAGEGGKDIYTHCVPVFRNGRQDLVLAPKESDPDNGFYVVQTERYAEMFYYPASQAQLEQMNSQAKQKQLDEDHARQQIDGLVQLGFMRSWKNDRQIDVGLGELFKVEFEVGGKKHVFPIEFFINMKQNIESIARTYAYANGFTINNYPPEISSRYFWQIVKSGTLEKTIEELEKKIKGVVKGTDEYKQVEKKLEETRKNKEIWEDFCSMMIKGWLVDPSEHDSEIPQFYWEWKEMTQKDLEIPEQGMEGLGGTFRLAFAGVKDVAGEQYRKIRRKKSSIWQKTLGRPGLRANMIARWQADPIPGALKEIKKNFSDKIVFDFVEQLKNAEKDGSFLREKLGYRQQIKNAFLAGHIDERTYETLNNLVVNNSYRPDIRKNWNNPDYLIHKKWFTLHGFVIEKVAEMFSKMGEGNIKNNLTAQWVFMFANANPAGYIAAITAAGIGGGIFALVTSPAWFPTMLGILGSIQLGASAISGGIRAADIIVRWARKGRRGLLGSSADGLIFEQEYTGQQ